MIKNRFEIYDKIYNNKNNHMVANNYYNKSPIPLEKIKQIKNMIKNYPNVKDIQLKKRIPMNVNNSTTFLIEIICGLKAIKTSFF